MRHTTTVLITDDTRIELDDDWGGLGGIIICSGEDTVCPDGIHLNFLNDEAVARLASVASALLLDRQVRRTEKADVDPHETEGARP